MLAVSAAPLEDFGCAGCLVSSITLTQNFCKKLTVHSGKLTWQQNMDPLWGCISYEKMEDNCILMLVCQRVSPWYSLRWLDCSSKQSSVRCAWMVKRRWVEKMRISMLHLIRLSRVWLSNWQRGFLFHEHVARFFATCCQNHACS